MLTNNRITLLQKGLNMDKELQVELKKRFTNATNRFVNKIKDDPNVIAVIVCGSLAYDAVWEKSDIDMTVIIRDQVIKCNSYCVTEDDIVINVNIILRSNFKRNFEHMLGGSFEQSYYSKGKMIYTTDESLLDYFEEMKQMGRDDVSYYIFYTACELIHIYDKCQKWLLVKDDIMYAQYYLLKAAEHIARIEVCLSGEAPTRECIQKALSIRKEVISPFYDAAMSHHLTKDEVSERISLIEEYLDEHIELISEPVIKFMADGQIKTLTLITKYFHTSGHFIVGVFDYLSEKGVIERVSQTIRITPKSKASVEEIGYLYIPF